LKEITPELTRTIIELTEYQASVFDLNGFKWHEGYQPYEDMKWAMLMRKADDVRCNASNKKSRSKIDTSHLGRWGHTKRPDGGEWDLLGLEEYRGERPAFVGLHGCSGLDMPEYEEYIDFGQFKFQYKNIHDKTPVHLTYLQGKVLVAAANKNVKDIPFGELEQLIEDGYLKKTEDSYIPTFRITYKNKIGELKREQTINYDRLYKAASDIVSNYYDYCAEIVTNEIPEFMKDDLYQIGHACINILEIRGAILEEALRTGYISYAENDDRKMLGAYLII